MAKRRVEKVWLYRLNCTPNATTGALHCAEGTFLRIH